MNSDTNQAYHTLRKVSTEIRKRFPILQHQTLIGSCIALFSITIILLFAWLYAWCSFSPIITILVIAFFSSLLHELEHDTFHRLYFKNHSFLRNCFLALLWLFKPNTINPWIRRKIHLHHHRYSGTPEDIEERLIGNGLSYSFRRFFIMIDPLFSITQFPVLLKESKKFSAKLMLLSLFPMLTIYTCLWSSWLAYYLLPAHLGVQEILSQYMETVNFFMVVYVVPAMVRQACLVFISSTIHYSGGVNKVTEQVQVLTHWIFTPFQLFCFFFGQTHAIHHVFTAETFYIRHLLRKKSHQILKEYNVRFNDLGTFGRKNIYE